MPSGDTEAPHRAERADQAFATALAETAQCLVCVYDREGRIVRFNRACEQTTGFTRQEALGRDARELVIPPEEAHEFGPFLAEVWESGLPSPREGHWLTRDGGRRLISWANEPLLGEDGDVEYLVTTGLDVTDLERKAAELRRLAEEQAALRRVATLVAGDADPEQIFQTVTEEVCRLLGIPSAVLERFDDAATATIVGRFAQRPTAGFELGSILPLGEGLAALEVLRTGAAVRIDSYADVTGEIAARMRSAGFRSTVAVPISVAGTTWGALIAALREGETLPPGTERRMEGFAELVGLALASADARNELAASRIRIVEAGDAARHRLERNLHDGAQQRLVTLSLTLRLARDRLRDDRDAVASLLDAADTELSEALEELRELAHGLHPALLVERGLGPALEALATRAPFPVEVREVAAERLPEPVEATAYYVASEALANTAKHAEASSAMVRVECAGELALVEIVDDGLGGAGLADGTGLRGLADRVEALGGRLQVDSPPGRGTVVRAELPLTRRAPA